MSRKLIGNMHLAPAGFVQHIHRRTIAESRFPVDQQHIDILYEAIVSDIVVRQIILDIFDNDIIPYTAMMNHGTMNAAMLSQAAGQMKLLFKHAQADIPRKVRLGDIRRIETILHEYPYPIIAGATVLFQPLYFGRR